MPRTLLPLASILLVSAAAVLVAPSAHALGPVDLEVGAKVGAATNPISGSGVTNPLGFGLGGRAGLAFLGGIYAGGSILYYLGGSADQSVVTPGNASMVSTLSVSTHTLMYGGELGYGIKILDLLTIRPQVGLGNATFTQSGGGQSASASYWYLEPGVTGLVGLGPLFVGADLNGLFFPSLSGNQAAFSAHGQVGVKF